MAMTMNGEVQLAAPREMVWEKLNDPEVLKVCIPGCVGAGKDRGHRLSCGGENKGRAGVGRASGAR